MSDERKIDGLTVKVDRDSCIGSANCVKVAPDLFALDDEGIAAFAPDADSASAETVLEACGVCPVEALIVLGPDGAQRIP